MHVRHVPGRRLWLPVRAVHASGRRRVKAALTRTWFLVVLALACASSNGLEGTGGGTADAGGTAGGGGGGGSSGGGGTVVEGLPLATACSTLNRKRCEYLERCGLIGGSMEALLDCQAWLVTTWCGPTKWPARVDVGTLLYDGKQAQACADAW